MNACFSFTYKSGCKKAGKLNVWDEKIKELDENPDIC